MIRDMMNSRARTATLGCTVNDNILTCMTMQLRHRAYLNERGINVAGVSAGLIGRGGNAAGSEHTMGDQFEILRAMCLKKQGKVVGKVPGARARPGRSAALSYTRFPLMQGSQPATTPPATTEQPHSAYVTACHILQNKFRFNLIIDALKHAFQQAFQSYIRSPRTCTAACTACLQATVVPQTVPASYSCMGVHAQLSTRGSMQICCGMNIAHRVIPLKCM